MSTYQARLQLAMKQAGIEVPALAKLINTSEQAIYKLLSGGTKRFSTENNLAAATVLRVNPDWLITGKGDMNRTPVVSELTAQYTIYGQAQPPTTELAIPQYDAGGQMGNGGLLLDEQPGLIKSWHVTAEWVSRNVRGYSSIKNLCIVTGFGPSMQPMYNPGDPLIVDTGVDSCTLDGVYFFRIEQHGFIKLLQRVPTSEGVVIRAKSKNPDYDAFDITPEMDFQVLGRVLRVWRGDDL